MRARRSVNLALLLAVAGCVGRSAWREQRDAELPRLEQRVFEGINQQRRNHGLGGLKWNEKLAQEARRHARNMAARRFFSHVDPVRGDLIPRLKSGQIQWRDIGENLCEEEGSENPGEDAIQGWMKSPGHRRNILNKVFTQTGVGAAFRGDGTLFIVQEFMRP